MILKKSELREIIKEELVKLGEGDDKGEYNEKVKTSLDVAMDEIQEAVAQLRKEKSKKAENDKTVKRLMKVKSELMKINLTYILARKPRPSIKWSQMREETE